MVWWSFYGSFGVLGNVILAPLGPPGGPPGSKYLPGPSLDPPKTLQENFLEPPRADLKPNLSQLGASFGPTWANLRPTWAHLEATWSQLGAKLGQSCLQKAILSDLEAISRPLEAREARDPQFYQKNYGILIENEWKSAPKISKIHYYSSSKCIFVFF